MAYASLCETETHLIIASELGYMSAESLDKVLAQASEIGKMLNGLMASLRSKLNSDT